MQCTGCGKSLSTDELRGENCPYCETALPHRSQAIANAASVKELLRDDNQDGVPDILEGTHLDPRNKPKKVELSEEEWTRVDATVEWFSNPGDDGTYLYNFWEATRGIGTVTIQNN